MSITNLYYLGAPLALRAGLRREEENCSLLTRHLLLGRKLPPRRAGLLSAVPLKRD
jgi:hypothetical protein